MHEATSPCGALQRGEKAPGSLGRMHHPLAYIDVFFISLSQGKKYFALFLKSAEINCQGWHIKKILLSAQHLSECSTMAGQIILQKVHNKFKCLPCHEHALNHLLLSFHSMEQSNCKNKKSEQTPFILLVFECNFSPNECICFG